ncbi:nucleoside deaminase [Ignatzschineria sp. LJL83]
MNRDNFKEVVEATLDNIQQGGRPFGASVVKDGKVVATAVNTMLHDLDPTAHAEMSAIRKAAKVLGTVDLSGCVIYASGEPCPMCQAAMYMAGIREAYYIFSNEDGAPYNLSTAIIADEMRKMPEERTGFTFQQVLVEEREKYPHLYQVWSERE